MTSRDATFPLLSRRRAQGASVGLHRSSQRGSGFEIVSTRAYQRGDTMRSIDWNASARLSTARQSDEFVVRDHFAEESPRVVLLVDRRPEMALYPAELPWLHKQEVVAVAGRMIVQSALAAHGIAGLFDASGAEGRWTPPSPFAATWIRDRALVAQDCAAPPDALARALRRLQGARRDLPSGTFLFVLSDFLAPPPEPLWRSALARGWDIVPVVIQDPRWEQSFPTATGVALPLADARGASAGLVRLSRHEARRRRAANEARLATLFASFARLDMDGVLLSSESERDVLSAFRRWHERRRRQVRRLG